MRLVTSPLRYPGGKSRAAKLIISKFPQGIEEYREPMVGGGSVFLLAKQMNLAKRYWISDAYWSLINFWQVLQDSSKIMELYALCLAHSLLPVEMKHSIFDELRKQEGSYSSLPINEAFRFFLLNRCSFSGTVEAGGFSKSAAADRFNQASCERLLKCAPLLKDVKISWTEYTELLRTRADLPEVFMFLDPPYYTAKKLYGPDGRLHWFNHGQLAERLKGTKHKFLVTYDDCSYIRELYSWANIEPWIQSYGMGKNKQGKELFISNY